MAPSSSISRPWPSPARCARRCPGSRAQPAPGEDPGAWLGRLLQDRELLVVLDNFEQVDEAAPLVRTLIRAAPHLRVVVTSRVVLGIAGETEYRLEPLPVGGLGEVPSTAAALFISCARRVREQTSMILPTLGRSSRSANVSTNCTGNRARGGTYEEPLAGILSRGDSTVSSTLLPPAALPFLSASGPCAGQSARAGAARPDARELFLSLAPFPAGCRLDLLDSEVADIELLESLQTLVEASLLHRANDPDGEPRYRMSQPSRDYALEQLRQESAPGPISVERYCLGLVQAMAPRCRVGLRISSQSSNSTPNLLRAVDDLERRGASLKALDLMADLGPLWERGSIGEARERLAALFGAIDDGPSRTILRAGGSPDDSPCFKANICQPPSSCAPRSMRPRPTPPCASPVSGSWAGYRRFWASFETAEETFSGAVTAAPTLGAGRQAQATLALGRVKAERGEGEAGRGLVHRSLGLWEQVGDLRGATSASSSLARIALLAGDAETARIWGETRPRGRARARGSASRGRGHVPARDQPPDAEAGQRGGHGGSRAAHHLSRPRRPAGGRRGA